MDQGPSSSTAVLGGPSSSSAVFGGPNSSPSTLRVSSSTASVVAGLSSSPAVAGGPSSSPALIGGPVPLRTVVGDTSSSSVVVGVPSSTSALVRDPSLSFAVVEAPSSLPTVLRGPSSSPAVVGDPQVEQIEVLESLELPTAEEMSGKRSNSFRCAILQGNRQLCNTALLEESGLSLVQRMIRHVAYEVLPREIDRKWFYDNYTGCPPPWFMIAITIVEVAIFVYYGLVLDRFVLQVTHRQYLKNPLIFHPQLRNQTWRYLSYMFMHAGIEHLGVNVALQLLVGVPLEMVHGTARISFLYVAGILAGSLAVSLADMTAPAVGSSGGVYAIISAHLANIVMNWSGMRCQFKLLRMSFALICMSLEFGRAVWLRFYPSAYPPCPHPSFVAHLGGVLVGITLGVVVLRNFEQRLQDQTLWWVFLGIYVLFVVFAVLWNIFAFSMPGLRLPPPP